MADFLTPAECIEGYANNVAKKNAQKRGVLFGKAIMAGTMIAIGAASSSVAAHSISNVGVARMAAGVVFPVGLMLVILLGAELFTGDCMMAVGVSHKVISIADCIKMLVIVYIGNFVGSIVIAALIYFSGQLGYSGGLMGAYTMKIAIGKVNLTFGQGITSGILCNFLVCGAVLLATCAKDVTGKLLSSFFVIFAFVTSGFEHCVANMYYITAGLFCKMDSSYVDIAMNTYGYTQAQIDSLNIGNFFTANLLPVTIGNIIGGILLVAFPVYYFNGLKKKVNNN